MGNAGKSAESSTFGIIHSLAGNPRFVFSWLALFCYVGAQQGVWNDTIFFVQDSLPGFSTSQATNIATYNHIIRTIGLFSGTCLLLFVSEEFALVVLASASCVLCVLASVLDGWAGVVCWLACSFFMGPQYPQIFSLGMQNVKKNEQEVAAGITVMAIVAGGLSTPIMGAIADAASWKVAAMVPAVLFSIISAYAMYLRVQRSAQERDIVGKVSAATHASV